MCKSTEKYDFRDKLAATSYGQRYGENLRSKQPFLTKSPYTAKKPLKAMFRTSYWPILKFTHD